MKIAYLIQAHKNYKQICMLVDNLIDEYTDVYIHIDKKQDKLYEQLLEKYLNDNNIYIIENREVVNWSGFSQVKATLNLMNEASQKNYNYISLISGQCFPIKSNDYIRQFLNQNKGKEFIEYQDITNDKNNRFRLKCYNFFRENKYIRTLPMRILDNIIRRFIQKPFVNRKNFIGMNLYHGSSWFTITFECMKFIIEYIEDNPVFMEDFKYTLAPDEHFFQMIILNSKYKENVVNNNLRYIDWTNCKNSPNTLTIKYKNDFLKEDYIIARKFDIEIDEEIVDIVINHRKSN